MHDERVRQLFRRVAIGAAITLGALALAIGVGVGIPFAVATGASTTSVVGLLALATGIGLIGVSLRVGLHRASLRRKLLAVPVGIVILFGAVLPVTLALFVTHVPPIDAGDQDPGDLDLPYADVMLQTADGVELAAWYIPSSNRAAVVLVAGATGVRSDELDHAAVLARHGYGVLLVDSRGHGDSGGDAMLWGWHGDADIGAAVDYLVGRPDLDDGRIAAMGMSMGAEEAIGAAAADERIAAVVAEGVTARGPRDEGDPAGGVGGWFTRYFDWAATHTADVLTSADRPVSLHTAVAMAAPTPVLIVAGGTEPAEIAAAEVFRSDSPGNVQVWVAADAGHTKAYDVHPAEWEARVIGFLDTSMRAEV